MIVTSVMMSGMFSPRGEWPGRLVAKIVDSLDYASFPFVRAARCNLYNYFIRVYYRSVT